MSIRHIHFLKSNKVSRRVAGSDMVISKRKTWSSAGDYNSTGTAILGLKYLVISLYQKVQLVKK